MQSPTDFSGFEGTTHVRDGIKDVEDVIVITKRDRVQGGAKIRRELVDRYLGEVHAPGIRSTPAAPQAT